MARVPDTNRLKYCCRVWQAYDQAWDLSPGTGTSWVHKELSGCFKDLGRGYLEGCDIFSVDD
jgi:hypothetical protein